MGAEFAAGFFFGTNVGTFDEGDLFDCFQIEPAAEDIFFNADKQIKGGLQQGDPELALGGFQSMIDMVLEMAAEGTDDGQPKCPFITVD